MFAAVFDLRTWWVGYFGVCGLCYLLWVFLCSGGWDAYVGLVFVVFCCFVNLVSCLMLVCFG